MTSRAAAIACLIALVGAATACTNESRGHGALTSTSQALTATLFFDSFEGSSEFGATGDCTISSAAAASGSSGVRCNDTASLIAGFSAEGARDVRVSYTRRTNLYDSGEVFRAEFSLDGGASWRLLEEVGNSAFSQVSFALGAGADGAVVLLRFSSSADGFLERFDLDDVLATGELPDTPADNDQCNAVDDDLDGNIDEDFAGGTTTCGVGGCQSSGELQCSDGTVVDTCSAGAPSADDACDGVDDDCDGTVDEDGACGPSSLFAEDFELDLSQYALSGDCAISSAALRGGVAGVRCNDVSALTATFSSVGFADLVLRYSRRTNGYDSGESFFAEVSSDGVEWTVIEQVGSDTTYRDREVALPASAADQPALRIRFRSDANGFFERFDLDDVSVVGQPTAPDSEPDPEPVPLPDPDGLAVRMDPSAGDFFGMPWPSDHRRLADGTPDLAGYPGVDQGQLGLGHTLVDAFAPSLQGFGTSSAAYFTFNAAIDPSRLPGPVASTADSSAVMLVNLDDPQAERVPVLLDFKSASSSARPGQLLTVLPAPGFSLAPDSTYAAIVFDSLGSAAEPLLRAPLLDRLASGPSAGSGLDHADFALLQTHKQAIDAYVAQHTAMTSDRVVAFAVYTTQPIGEALYGAAAVIEAMSDDEILARFDALTPVRGCLIDCQDTEICPSAILDATLQLPRFQTPISLDIDAGCVAAGGDRCVASSGGAIARDTDGRVEVRAWEQGVRARIQVPCQQQQPADGWPILFRAVGSGGTADSGAVATESTFFQAGLSLNHVVVSITPYQTFPRQDTALAGVVAQALASLTGSPPDQRTLNGVLYSFPFNPMAGRNNVIQSAADALFAKRVAQVLARAASGLGVDPTALGLRSGAFTTNAGRATLLGQSQGAASSALALAVPPAMGGYRDAYLNAPSGLLSYEAIVHRGDTRPIFESVFAFESGELDRFHPFGQLLQMASEDGSALNYAWLVATENLFLTSGFRDGCAPREAVSALATALARAGKLQAADTALAFEAAGLPVPVIDGIQSILQQPLLPLPAAGNLAGGGTGVFMLLDGFHGGSGTDLEVAAFLSELGQGLAPTLAPPPYHGFGDFVCGSHRID